MSLWQAIRYFVVEGASGLLRSWRASSIAVLTIALSLYVGAVVLLLTGSLSSAASRWRSELRVTIYLLPEIEPAQEEIVRTAAESPPWVLAVLRVSGTEATDTFVENFPELGDLAASGALELPAQYSVRLIPELAKPALREPWAEQLRQLPGVEMVDDDETWLSTLSAAVETLRSAGLVLGFGLLVAAGFTIAGVIRLSAFLYVEEIDTLRLIGATEFFIRGPFYMSGLLQGLIGGLFGLCAFWLSHHLALSRARGAFWEPLLLGSNLPWSTQLLLVALGGGAGLTGAVLSLRRERLGSPEE